MGSQTGFRAEFHLAIPKIFIEGCPGEDYLPDITLFGWVGCIIKFSLRRRPLTGGAFFGKPLSPN